MHQVTVVVHLLLPAAIVQSGALTNERAELAILGRRLVASVGLIRALGGGWEAAAPKATTAPNS